MKTTIPMAIVLLACVSSPVLHAEEPLKISGKTMGSYYAIVIDSPGSADGERLQKDLPRSIDRCRRGMSHHRSQN